MSAERIDFLQFRIRFLEQSKLDVAVRSAQVQLIRAFEGHGIEGYEKVGLRHNRQRQVIPIAAGVVARQLLFPTVTLELIGKISVRRR